MKKHSLILVPILSLLALATLAMAVTCARPVAGFIPESPTRTFSIDGRRFVVERPGAGDLSLLERELRTAGVDSLPPEALAAMLPGTIPDPLRELSPLISDSLKALPAGLEAEHALRMETDTGPVEIAFGGGGAGLRGFHRRLCAEGWDCSGMGANDGQPRVATLTKGRETSIVIMDEKEGRFLFLRRLEE